MKIDFYCVSILGLILISIGLFSPLQIQTDSISYTNALDLLLGNESEQGDRLMRLSKPFSLFLPAFLVSLGISGKWAMIIQQYLSLVISLYFIYNLYTKVYFFDKASSLRSILIYLSSSVIFVHAYAALNDMPAWAYTWFLIWYSHKIQDAVFPFPKYILWGVLAALGIFIKESILVAGVYIFLLILFDKNKKFLQKIKIYIAIGLPFFFSLMIGLYLTKSLFNYNLLDWFAFNHDDESTLYSEHWLKVYLVHFIRIFDVFWYFLPFGIFWGREKSVMIDNQTLYFKNIYLIGACFLFLIYPFVWAYMSERIMFMFAPFYLYLLALGLKYFADKNAIITDILLALAIISNLLATYGSYIGLWNSILWIVYITYMLLFLLIKIGITYIVIPKYKN